jgi:hypothetical protein
MWIVMSFLAGACSGHELASGEPEPSGDQHHLFPVAMDRALDILFVIDNSGSMAEEQASLTQNFQRFMDVLEYDGGWSSLHIGVVSTDLGAGPHAISGCEPGGDSGALQATPRTPECQGPDGAFIRDIRREDGTRERNYDGELRDAFSCIAGLGTDGCGFEQPLEAMHRALDGSNPGNAGFLRDNAYLLVVFITDEDDCSVFDTAMFDTSQNSMSDPLGPLSSFRCFDFGVQCSPDAPREPGARTSCEPRQGSAYMHDVTRYVDFLRGLKPGPNMVLVAGITGAPEPVAVTIDGDGNAELAPSCQAASGQAAPAVRLGALLEAFPLRNTLTSICNEDLSEALILIANFIVHRAAPCLQGNLYDSDGDPSNGVQPECVISARYADGSERVLFACDDAAAPGDAPCYVMEQDIDTCPDTDSHLTVRAFHDQETPPGVMLDVRCRI